MAVLSTVASPRQASIVVSPIARISRAIVLKASNSAVCSWVVLLGLAASRGASWRATDAHARPMCADYTIRCLTYCCSPCSRATARQLLHAQSTPTCLSRATATYLTTSIIRSMSTYIPHDAWLLNQPSRRQSITYIRTEPSTRPQMQIGWRWSSLSPIFTKKASPVCRPQALPTRLARAGRARVCHVPSLASDAQRATCGKQMQELYHSFATDMCHQQHIASWLLHVQVPAPPTARR